MKQGGKKMKKVEKKFQEKDLDIIEGEFIKISQSTVRNLEGAHIEMQQVGAISIDGEKIEASQCAALMVRGDNVNMHQGVSMISVSNNMSLNFSCTPLSISKCETTINNSATGIVAAGTVKSENSAAMFVIANKVEGNISTLFDWKSALAISAVLGGIFGMLSLIKRK
jgi:hypothetical protein